MLLFVILIRCMLYLSCAFFGDSFHLSVEVRPMESSSQKAGNVNATIPPLKSSVRLKM